ncbi:MAG: sugar ABC transporter substrate-binding protein [Lachnospiraceae bacterium]|nr:sugar ABC transporter substrate-binding protein [Lachnospiraceae bacterium]MDY3729169.1 sugar ABC transporter substrate-binding protein [Candidatus Choladocola sp.]
MKKKLVNALVLTTAIAAMAGLQVTAAEEEIPYGHFTAEGVSEEPIRLAFCSFQSNPFFLQVKDGCIAATEYLADYNCTVDYINMGEELTSDNVIAGIENAITMEYDGIAVNAVFDGTDEVINKAVDAGIPVVTYIAEGSEPGKRFCYVGQDAYSAGQTAGQAIADFMGGEGKMAVITGVFGAVQHEDRMNGALDLIKEKYPDIEVVGTVENNDSATTAYSQTMDFLTANPDLKVVYVTAGGTFGAAQAIQELGLTGQVGVVGYDHTPENMEYVYSGEIVAAISQDPEGQAWDALTMLYNTVVFGTEYEPRFATDNIVVTPETAVEMYGEYEG